MARTIKQLFPLFLSALSVSIFSTTTYAQEPMPHLEAVCEASDYVKNLPPTAPHDVLNFRGLLIEETSIEELNPLKLFVFFDEGRSGLTEQYNVFRSRNETAGFSDSMLLRSTMRTHAHLLDIIGYRMRRYPDATIAVVGSNSKQPEHGETQPLSAERVNTVVAYLTDIWAISADRIRLLPARDLPSDPSDNSDLRGMEDNRRVEIITDDYRIAGIVSQRDFRRTPQPDSVVFRMSNGIADSMIERREIEITWTGERWYTMRDIGIADPMSPGYTWGKGAAFDPIPTDETPYQAQLVLYLRDGRELRSDIVEVPVMIITEVDRNRWRERPFGKRTINQYNLTLFSYDDARLGAFNERVLEEIVYPGISAGAQIEVVGHTDDIGAEKHNLALSERRAGSVVASLQRNVDHARYTKLESSGIGEESPLYTNVLPEGRFYNRTVVMLVVVPDKTTQRKR